MYPEEKQNEGQIVGKQDQSRSQASAEDAKCDRPGSPFYVLGTVSQGCRNMMDCDSNTTPLIRLSVCIIPFSQGPWDAAAK